ncbi:hypothetical protein D9757_004481 [Collybiopsis confluens]|uniref:Uncharacterized protein n=1 Tax=Collybiopsis confluens TaxID=2823264 RepID=A0A8H5HWA8_9AGAR|nr:hypothetical protein D9757_004481 [Collybiopsis confluens]
MARPSDPIVVQWSVYTDSDSSFTNTVGPGFVGGNCAFRQITTEDLSDAIAHGADLRSVYASHLGLSTRLDPSTIQFRATDKQITSQVTGALLHGLVPDSSQATALIQINDALDSLQPIYNCPSANSLFSTDSTNWTEHLTATKSLYKNLNKVSGIVTQDSTGWHASFDQSLLREHVRETMPFQLPAMQRQRHLTKCIESIYRLANYEYSYYYQDAPQIDVIQRPTLRSLGFWSWPDT